MVALDELVERDPQPQELFVFANVGVRGAAGAVAAWGLEDAVGSALPDVGVWGVGACVAMAIHGLRMKVAVWIPDGGEGWLNPRTWLGWLEVGGVLGIVAAVFLAPFLALGIVVVATILGAFAWQAGRQLEHTRRPSPVSALRRESPPRGKPLPPLSSAPPDHALADPLRKLRDGRPRTRSSPLAGRSCEWISSTVSCDSAEHGQWGVARCVRREGSQETVKRSTQGSGCSRTESTPRRPNTPAALRNSSWSDSTAKRLSRTEN